MENINQTNKYYEGFGFVEALLAIMATGIAATVLMTISASSMKQLMQLEDTDKMSQLARTGAVLAQQIADNDSTLENPDQKIFNTGTIVQGCFPFNSDSFSLTGTTISESLYTTEADFSYDPDLNPDYKYKDYKDFFRVICIQGVDTTNPNTPKVVIKIVTGLVKGSAENTSGSGTQNYEYITVIDL